MEIRLPKIDIKCPNCGSGNLNFFNDGWHKIDFDEILIDLDCNNCGIYFNIKLIFEDEQTFYNCELCKKLMVDKGCEVN